MINSLSYTIVGIDMSYRDSGVCILNRANDSLYTRYKSFENNTLTMGFNGILNASIQLASSINEIKKLIKSFSPNLIVVEMPAYTQSAKAAICIGMCWGAVGELESIAPVIFIEPSFLKKWSGSKSGDKKIKVKEKVIARMGTFKESSNDNIVDAIGICYAVNDLISHEAIQARR